MTPARRTAISAILLLAAHMGAGPSFAAPAADDISAPHAAAPAPPSPAAAPHDPAAHLREILARPPYQRWQRRQDRALHLEFQTGASEFSTRVAQAIAGFFERLFNWVRNLAWKWRGPSLGNWTSTLATLPTMLQWLGWGVLAIGIVALATMAVRAWRRSVPAAPGARILSRAQVRRALDQGEALTLDSPQWLAEAQRLAHDADPRLAYRALYLALLSGLHGAGKIDFRPNRTNWIYVSRFRGPDEQRALFTGLTDDFDRVWYGLQGADAARVDSLRDAVLQLVRSGA